MKHALVHCQITGSFTSLYVIPPAKTGTKMVAMSGLEEYGGNLISIGKQPVNESMMFATEKFLLNFVASDFITVIKSNGTSFNQLRLKHYRSKHSKS